MSGTRKQTQTDGSIRDVTEGGRIRAAKTPEVAGILPEKELNRRALQDDKLDIEKYLKADMTYQEAIKAAKGERGE